jgi:hypothetical protein
MAHFNPTQNTQERERKPMAQNATQPDSGLSVPIAAAVWQAPSTIYKYDREAGVGTFSSTNNAVIYAPEKGLLVIAKDGSWILKADVVKDGKALGIREWVGVSPVDPSDGVKSGMVINRGAPIGISKGDFSFSLEQSIDNVRQTLDPVPYLIMAQARFVDASAEQRKREALSRAPAQAQTHSPTNPPNRSTELATTAPAQEIVTPQGKPAVGMKHLVAVGVGGILLGGLVTWGMKKK